jgi:hypothetical protein
MPEPGQLHDVSLDGFRGDKGDPSGFAPAGVGSCRPQRPRDASKTSRFAIGRMALIALALIWAGMVIGVALIAVPAQFTAGTLAQPVGIDVTRHVFSAFSRVELGLAVASAVVALVASPPRRVWLLLGVLWLIVAVQSLWLLPLLEARVDRLLAGETLPPAPWHRLYGILEMLKLVALLALAVMGLWPRRREMAPPP